VAKSYEADQSQESCALDSITANQENNLFIVVLINICRKEVLGRTIAGFWTSTTTINEEKYGWQQ